MAEFTGDRDTRVRIRKPIEEVFKAFTDPEVRASCMPDLDRYEKVSEGTYRWIMKEENEKGIRFTPDYTVKYEDNGENKFWWKSITGNPSTRGEGSVRAVGDAETEVRFHETITTDIPVPRLLAPVIRGIVGKKIAAGVDHYLEMMKAKLERG